MIDSQQVVVARKGVTVMDEILARILFFFFFFSFCAEKLTGNQITPSVLYV